MEPCEGTIGMLTVTRKQVVGGKLFGVNTQWCYKATVDKLLGCGCGGKKKELVTFYIVEDNNVDYQLDGRFIVESTVPIKQEDQDFMTRRENIGDSNLINDFDPYRKNNDPDEIIRRANNIPM